MGDLPCCRVKKRRTFEVVGTDLMGPVTVSIGRSRVKRYICIFNCLATKAVHLGVVPSSDADGFLQAFQRFAVIKMFHPKRRCGILILCVPYTREASTKYFSKFSSIVTQATLSEFDLLT